MFSRYRQISTWKNLIFPISYSESEWSRFPRFQCAEFHVIKNHWKQNTAAQHPEFPGFRQKSPIYRRFPRNIVDAFSRANLCNHHFLKYELVLERNLSNHPPLKSVYLIEARNCRGLERGYKVEKTLRESSRAHRIPQVKLGGQTSFQTAQLIKILWDMQGE